MIRGQNERILTTWRQTRRIATLLRNAHFKDPITEEVFMPLGGDDERSAREQDPEVAFRLLAEAMGSDVVQLSEAP